MTRRPAVPSGRSRLGRPLSLLAAPLLAVPLLSGAALPGSAADDPGATPTGVLVSTLPGGDADRDPITLVTGDRVLLEPARNGRTAAVVEAAPRPSGQEPAFEVLEDGDDRYVIPSDAASLIPDRLDPELFNITKLVDYGYTDGVSVIVTDAAMRAAAAHSEGLTVTDRLSSVDGYAATVEPDGDWWSSTAPATAAGPAAAMLAGAEKVWLDEVNQVSLDESVPMTGAPEAWAGGYDGTGTTVAVLDSGVDANHPDLTGQIAGAENFTSEADVSDGHGHGTHVAGTVAGTGNGSDGAYTGVAPGADLLIGKICTSSGSCPNSATIAGMEWAAQRADVVSLSIGTRTGNDGGAPTAQAVNELTEQYDTLFVIAAGNNGAQGEGSIAAPGAADAALTVGAVDKAGELASFSSRGPRKGDFALKPDITAPGVGIAAPRAAGTSMGTPVNDLYTRANGTSMATPHVSGSAAIVLQKYPDLGAGELKALLSSTASPHPDLTVYEQGGGLVDIPAALDAPVRATPAPLNLGFFPYAQQRQPVEKTVTYTNSGHADVALDLAPEVTHRDGTVVPESMLSVSPGSLTVPAGGTATATVTLDTSGAATGSYGGYLVADGAGGQVRTGIGFHLESEMYDVRIKGIARDGRPAGRSSQLHVRHAVDWDIFAQNSIRFVDGEAHVRVPPGPYYLGGAIRTYDGHDRIAQGKTIVSVPTLDVTEDTTVTLDARESNEVTFETPEHPDARPHGRSRVILHFEAERDGHLTSTWLSSWERTYALASEPPTVGRNAELMVDAQLGDAPLVLELIDPEARELHPRSLYPSPDPEGDRELPVVYAGTGAESDYADLDVDGKVVLIERSGEDNSEEAAVAHAHGAEALLLANDTTGRSYGRADGAQIPVLALSDVEGGLLKEHLADGGATVRLAGTAQSSYLYDLFVSEQGGIPADLHYEVDQDELATLHNSFHGPPGQEMGEYRAAWRPYMTAGFVQVDDLFGATARTEYVTADDTKYRQTVVAAYPSAGDIKERDTFHTPGEVQRRDWFKSPMRPSILEADPPVNPGYPVTRTGDTISMQLMEWWDNDYHYGVYESGEDTGAFRFYQDGVKVGETAWPRVRITNLDPEPHTYRFEVDMTREADWWPTSTETSTAWTLEESERPDQTERLPFLLVDYETELDLTNTAPTPADRQGPATLDLRVRHQAGADAPAVAGAKVWISYDDGETWEKRPVRALGGGEFRAVLDSPDPADTPTGYVSLRFEAWDADNNRIEQEVTRAWRLAAR